MSGQRAAAAAAKAAEEARQAEEARLAEEAQKAAEEERKRQAREAAATKAREEKRIAEAAKAAEKAAAAAAEADRRLQQAGGVALCWDLQVLLAPITPHKDAGSKCFGVGDYAGAFDEYTAAVDAAGADPALLAWPPIESIVLACRANAALCCLKLGRNAAALAQCDAALALPGGVACGKSLLSKLLLRRLTALVEMFEDPLEDVEVRTAPPTSPRLRTAPPTTPRLRTAPPTTPPLLAYTRGGAGAGGGSRPAASSGQVRPRPSLRLELARSRAPPPQLSTLHFALKDVQRRGLASGKGAPAAKSFAELAARMELPPPEMEEEEEAQPLLDVCRILRSAFHPDREREGVDGPEGSSSRPCR